MGGGLDTTGFDYDRLKSLHHVYSASFHGTQLNMTSGLKRKRLLARAPLIHLFCLFVYMLGLDLNTSAEMPILLLRMGQSSSLIPVE